MLKSRSGGALVILLLVCVSFSDCSRANQITEDTRNQMDPALYGDIVVWEDDRNANWDIYGYNLAASQEFQVTTNTHNQYDPEVYSGIVVWMDERNGNYDIYGFNLSTYQEFQIAANESNQINPAIYGDIVVWQDWRNGNWDIYGFNLQTKEEFQITTNESNQTNPALHSNTVVWQDYRNGNWDIYGFNLQTKEEFQVTTDTRNQENPAIYNDIIVWEDNRNNNTDIYGFNRSLSQEFQITTHKSNQLNPDISGTIIVWEDDRSGTPNIYRYDLSTSQESPVETAPALQQNPAIYSTVIIWEDYRNGNYDIFISGYTLSVTLFTLTVTVTDSAGNPISGATVTLGPSAVVTNEAGVAVITDIASGSYMLAVTAPGFQVHTRSLYIADSAAVAVTLIESSSESESGQLFSVAVTVKDTLQNPIPGAVATLAGPSTYTGTTDAQGDTVFHSVTSGSYTLSVSAEGYQEWVEPVEVTEDKIIAVTLGSNVSVTITAHNASGNPVAGAVVMLRGPKTYTEQTDSQGKAVFTDVVHGVYLMTVSHSEYGTYTEPAFQITSSVTTVVKLNPEMGFIHGTVYWDTTDTLAKDVVVRIYDQTTSVLEKNVVTDFEGRFTAEVPKTKRYYIIVEDFSDQRYIGISPVNSLDRGDLTLIIDSQCRIKGVVLDEEGKEISGALVVVKDIKEQETARGETDSSGLFTIQITPGTYSVEISAPLYQVFTQTFTVSHKEIHNFGQVTLKKKPEARIDVGEEKPPVETVKPPTSEPLMIPVLITLSVCIVLLIALIIWEKNRSDFMKNALISVLAGIISIIVVWILFEIG